MADTERNGTADSSGGSPTALSEALRQSEERFRLMVEAVRDYAIFLLDPDGRIASWNAGAERFKQYTAEEIIGRHFSIFYPPDAIARGWPEHELEVAKKVGRFEDEGWRIRKDGSRFWANVVITALFDEEGRLWGFTKVTRDLTERFNASEALRRSERALAESNKRLRESNQELQDFASVASHDLQEPLRKVSTFAEMLAEESGSLLPETSLAYLDRIRDAAERMSRLIQDLLQFSRIATKGSDFVPVDLARVVREVLSDLEVRISETGGQVEVGELPTLEADPTQMRQLFQNLIGNALKFHQPDVPPVLRISATRPGGESAGADPDGPFCQIEVEDNGIGFNEKYLDRIFAPFQRLHTRSTYEGTGMGLAICRRIVERHGGSISARSTPGEGTTFIVVLPARHSGGDAPTP